MWMGWLGLFYSHYYGGSVYRVAMALFFSAVPPLVLEGAAVEGGPCGRVEVEGGGSFCSRRVICVWESSQLYKAWQFCTWHYLSPLGVCVPLSLLLLVVPPEQVAFLPPLPPPLTHSHHCRGRDIRNKVNWLKGSYSCLLITRDIFSKLISRDLLMLVNHQGHTQ